MTRNQLLTQVAFNIGVTKQKCDVMLDALVDAITDALARGESVPIQNLCIFEISSRPERIAFNVHKGINETYPEVKTVKCRFSKSLKAAINHKRKSED